MIAVIGCGNANRRDDGVGPAVLAELARRGLGTTPGLSLLDAGTDGMAVMFKARGCASLILIDACRSGSDPGAVFEVPGAELEAPAPDGFGLHDFRWDHALHAGRRIYGADFPADVTVLLIEAESVEFGIGLSGPVARAADQVAGRVEALLRERLTA